jgi:hypothetical protein
MSDTFSFRAAPQPLRRRVDQRAFRAAVIAFVLVLAVGSFARWVIGSERASEAAVGIHTVAPTVGTGDDSPANAADGRTPQVRQAERVAQQAAGGAGRLFGRHGSFVDAGPAQLSSILPAYTFVDGPSQDPSIVSVASAKTVWAAAVRSLLGGCYYIRVTATGHTSYGTGTTCTGAVALNAHSRTW